MMGCSKRNRTRQVLHGNSSAASPHAGRQVPGTFAWAGRDVAFLQTRSAPLLQIGAPPNLFRRIPWCENAGLVVPTLAACLLVAVITILAWPIRIVRDRLEALDRATAPDRTRRAAA